MDNKDATSYLIFAVGGTGAKAAEAAVNLMSLGIPMAVDPSDKGLAALHAADTLTIVRIDPDKACRAASLQEAVRRYQEIQRAGGQGESKGLWSLKLNNLETLHPMDSLSGPGEEETLLAKLASKDRGRDQATNILRLFYTDADLTTSLDRGFYQKPYIGAAVIAAMAETKLESKSQMVDLLKRHRGRKMRAFVVGSMYGGTGAAGLPVLARIIQQFAANNGEQKNWMVAGCLLGPYFYPPPPPLNEIEWGHDWKPDGRETLDAFLARTGKREHDFLTEITQRNRGKSLAGPGQDLSPEEIRQIARGYYARPEEIDERAFASWDYYQNHGTELFDQMYFLGMRNPTRYGEIELDRADYSGDPNFRERIVWSNGGRNQISPLHAVEYAAAAMAFHFFSRSFSNEKGTTLLGVHHHTSKTGDALCWTDLALQPFARMDRWFYAALAGFNWLRFSLAEHVDTPQVFENAKDVFPALHRFVDPKNYQSFHRDLRILIKNLNETMLHTLRALGWEEKDTAVRMREWYREPMSFAKTGGLFRRSAASHRFPGWTLTGVDAEVLGREVPGTDKIEILEQVATEARGSLPLAIGYLQSLWDFLASHMQEVKDS